MKTSSLVIAGLTLLAGLLAAGGLAYFTRWSMAVFGTLPLCSGFLGFLLLVLALLIRARAKRSTSGGGRRLTSLFLLVAVVLLVQPVYFPIAGSLRDGEVKRAQEFVEALIPRLEEYKLQHGVYPAALEPNLAGARPLPALLQLSGTTPLVFDNRYFYAPRENSYGFQFYLPDGFIGFHYDYCCGPDGVWNITD